MTREQLYSHAKSQEEKVHLLLEEMADAITELDIVHDNGLCTSAYIDYDEQDTFNAIRIFYSVAGNYAIKHGLLTDENTSEKINMFREIVKDVFGIDTVQEAKISVILAQLKNLRK